MGGGQRQKCGKKGCPRVPRLSCNQVGVRSTEYGVQCYVHSCLIYVVVSSIGKRSLTSIVYQTLFISIHYFIPSQPYNH
jgi:hypothetical protein